MNHKNVICMFCGALCDDLEVEVADGRITNVKNACMISKNKFMHHGENTARPMIQGKEVTLDQAVEKSIDILRQAKNPLIYGLSATGCEAQGEAIALAEAIGANIDSTSSVCHGPGSMAKQMTGIATCTLGEIKNRADLVVFWGCNPAEAHMRHFSRYSAMPVGMQITQGRKGRKLINVDVRKSKSAKIADQFIQVEPNGDYQVISVLRALLKGQSFPRDMTVGGVQVRELEALLEDLKNCSYGVILFGMGLTMTRGKYMNVQAALSLVSELNAYAKVSIMPMRGHGNVVGSENTLTWQTGYPFAVNFSKGYPRFNPGEFTVVDLLARKEVDAVFVIASDPMASLPLQAAEYLKQIPAIVIDPHWNATTKYAEVVLPSAVMGIEAAGTFYRMDNVPLRMKKFLESTYPSDKEIIQRIREGVQSC